MRHAACSFAILLIGSAHCPAQWSTYLIRSQSTPFSSVAGTRGATFQFGAASPTGNFSNNHAGIWSGLSGNTWIDLNPPSATNTAIYGSDGTTHVGSLTSAGVERAGFWTGTSNAFTTLQPSGYLSSRAIAVGGGHQAGSGTISGDERRALLWSGSAASAVSLHPTTPAARDSWVSSMSADGTVQLGTTAVFSDQYFNTRNYATYWHNTAASWTALAVGSFSDVRGNAISRDGTQAGGQGLNNSPSDLAMYWPTLASNPVNLHPGDQYYRSAVLAVDSGYQVGEVTTLDVGSHAALWAGTPQSFVDLHQFLPATYLNSEADGLWVDPTGIWVSGVAFDPANHTWESIIWHAPEPTSACGMMLGLACVLRCRSQRGTNKTRPRDLIREGASPLGLRFANRESASYYRPSSSVELAYTNELSLSPRRCATCDAVDPEPNHPPCRHRRLRQGPRCRPRKDNSVRLK